MNAPNPETVHEKLRALWLSSQSGSPLSISLSEIMADLKAIPYVVSVDPDLAFDREQEKHGTPLDLSAPEYSPDADPPPGDGPVTSPFTSDRSPEPEGDLAAKLRRWEGNPPLIWKCGNCGRVNAGDITAKCRCGHAGGEIIEGIQAPQYATPEPLFPEPEPVPPSPRAEPTLQNIEDTIRFTDRLVQGVYTDADGPRPFMEKHALLTALYQAHALQRIAAALEKLARDPGEVALERYHAVLKAGEPAE